MTSHSPLAPTALEVHHRMVRSADGKFLRIQISDFPSHVDQTKLLQEVERADGVVIVYDAQSAASLAQLPTMMAQLPSHVHKVVVGNLRGKAHSAADLTTQARQQALSSAGPTGIQLSNQLDTHFVEGCVARTEFAELLLLTAARAHATDTPGSIGSIAHWGDYIDATEVSRGALVRGTGRQLLQGPWRGEQYLGKPPEAPAYQVPPYRVPGVPAHSDAFKALATAAGAQSLGIHFRELWAMFRMMCGAPSDLTALQLTVPRDHLIRTLGDQEVRCPL